VWRSDEHLAITDYGVQGNGIRPARKIRYDRAWQSLRTVRRVTLFGKLTERCRGGEPSRGSQANHPDDDLSELPTIGKMSGASLTDTDLCESSGGAMPVELDLRSSRATYATIEPSSQKQRGISTRSEQAAQIAKKKAAVTTAGTHSLQCAQVQRTSMCCSKRRV